MSAGKHESVMAIYLYSIGMEAIDCKRVFRTFSGMIGSSAEWYPDLLLPTLGYAS
jgi:hypothetical protein